jgi:hypothetical protein
VRDGGRQAEYAEPVQEGLPGDCRACETQPYPRGNDQGQGCQVRTGPPVRLHDGPGPDGKQGMPIILPAPHGHRCRSLLGELLRQPSELLTEQGPAPGSRGASGFPHTTTYISAGYAPQVMISQRVSKKECGMTPAQGVLWSSRWVTPCSPGDIVPVMLSCGPVVGLGVLSHQVGDTRVMGVVPMPVWMRSVL